MSNVVDLQAKRPGRTMPSPQIPSDRALSVALDPAAWLWLAAISIGVLREAAEATCELEDLLLRTRRPEGLQRLVGEHSRISHLAASLVVRLGLPLGRQSKIPQHLSSDTSPPSGSVAR